MLSQDHAIAGVNGDFYDIGHTGAPLGLGKDRQRGLLHARQDGWNNAFYIDRKGRAGIGDLPMTAKVLFHPDLRITNLNSPFVAPGGIGIYTPRWGRTAGYGVTQGQRERVRQVTVEDGRVVASRRKISEDKQIKGLVLIGRGDGAARLRKELPNGTRVRVRWALAGNPQMAISGNQFLVHDGIIRAIDDRELHPRTAVGVDSDTGEVLLLVIDGRSSTQPRLHDGRARQPDDRPRRRRGRQPRRRRLLDDGRQEPRRQGQGPQRPVRRRPALGRQRHRGDLHEALGARST